MHNVLLRFCRLSKGLTKKQVAYILSISLSDYQQLEAGKRPLEVKHAAMLACLYKTRAIYLLDAADQLETFIARGEIVKILQSENERMNLLMEGGYEVIHQSKQVAAEQYS